MTNDIVVIDSIKSIVIFIVTGNNIVDDVIIKNSVKFFIVDCMFSLVEFIVV